MTDGPLRFVVGPTGDELAAALACESDVFLQTYGNTAEQFEAEYGPYREHTGFMTILREDGEAVAAARVIGPGPAGLKTLNDVSRPPWGADGLRSARSAGIDPARTWDLATIAVRKGQGRGGLCACALYHGFIAGSLANGINHTVMIMDAKARELLTAVGIHTETLPGTFTGEYLGSAESTPVWADIHRGLEQMRQYSPDAYRLIYHGVGLDGISLPTDWVWEPRT